MSRHDNQPSEKFTIQLYKEWGIEKQIFDIMDKKGWEYAYCLHDKDSDENGNHIKDHYYILMVKKNASTITAIAKNLGIESRWVQRVESYIGAAKYVNHSDDDSKAQGKYQYPLDDIKGPLADKVKEIISKPKAKRNSDNDLIRVIDWIENQGIIYTADVVRWSCQEKLMSVVQRTASLVRECIREHNEYVRSQSKVVDIMNTNNKLIVAENNRFASQYHIKSEIGNKELIRQECEQHLVNMEMIKEILEKDKISS